MSSNDSQQSDLDWIRQIKETAANNDLEGFRALVLSDIGRERGTQGLDPHNDRHINLMMASIRKHVREGEGFRRGVASEGLGPQNEIDEMALQAGVTPETLIKGAFAQGRNNEQKG